MEGSSSDSSGDLLYEKEDIVEQFAISARDFSSQYGSDGSMSYSADNLTGSPSKFPSYGDYPQTFALRTYGEWWRSLPSHPPPLGHPPPKNLHADDFVDLEFEKKVFPQQICIYETFNPGAVVCIWARTNEEQGGEDGQGEGCSWVLLWEGMPKKVSPVRRVFCPPLRKITFPTNFIRIELNQRHQEYYSELDSVLLVGALPHPNICFGSSCSNATSADAEKAKKKECNRLAHQLRRMGFHYIPKVDLLQINRTFFQPEVLSREFSKEFSRNGTVAAVQEGHWPKKSIANGPTGKDWLSWLPREVILKIFQYLDLKSLIHCSRVCCRLNTLAADPWLYTSVNLKPYWYCVNRQTLKKFLPRCHLMQKLDLSWCGNYGRLDSASFKDYIITCNFKLTNLRLDNCHFLDDESIIHIVENFPGLVELSLRNCRHLRSEAFIPLAKLEELRRLDLYRTHIDLFALKGILIRNPHLQHLNLGACTGISMDGAMAALAKHNKDLRSLDVWKTSGLTSVGISSLAQCTLLEEIDLGWCMTIMGNTNCFKELSHSCRQLKKLCLTALRIVSDSDLEALSTSCPLLEQLDLLGNSKLSSDAIKKLFYYCSKLRLLDLSFCMKIPEWKIFFWRACFPSINIKQSSNVDDVWTS